MKAGISIYIQVEDGLEVASEWVEVLETAVFATLSHQHLPPPAALTLLLTDDAHIQHLNRDFRGYDKPTDVLSFPNVTALPGKTVPYLGDIAVSVPYAARQAAATGHGLLAELQLLTVHGVLHLLGHDHAETAEKQRMWQAQTAVLTQLGIGHITPTAE